MRLFPGRIPVIAEELVETLVRDKDIETHVEPEVRLDIESVLKEYVRQDRQVLDDAKSRMEIRGLPYGMLGRTKAQLTRERQLPAPDEVLPYLIEQLLAVLFHSQNVDEVFAEDTVLRKKMTTILKRHMEVEGELDEEVRSKIKNLEEGTAAFEIEYAKVLEQIKRKKRLT